MADYTFIAGEKKHWRNFIDSINEGENAIVLASTCGEIDCIRTVASKINVSGAKPFKYVIEADSSSLKVRISTKKPL